MPATPSTEATVPQTPLHNNDTRLDESQAVLENEEDPRIPDDAPIALSSLPVEAIVRAADET
ncbi:MAG: hypothetical protein V4505_05020 [Pseudomonadota bacterium]